MYLALFFTHSGAMKYNRFIKKKGTKSELMPVPRRLSSSCGIAAKFEYNDKVDEIISDDIEKLYMIVDGEYKLIYSVD